MALSVPPKPVPPTEFHEGTQHNHLPSGRWSEVQANPNNDMDLTGTTLAGLCKVMTPNQLVDKAKTFYFGDKPTALKHLNWYLTSGGAEFKEDDNIDKWLTSDSKSRGGTSNLIRGHVARTKQNSGKWQHQRDISSDEYENGDFQASFGAIDRLDFEVDFDGRGSRSGSRIDTNGIPFIQGCT